MDNIDYASKTKGGNAAKPAAAGAKTFVLWREVVMAYIAPAIMAGIGGWITADKNLQLGACTTIGGASALVAWLLGLWLRGRGNRKGWITRAPRLIVAGVFALTAAPLGLLAAWVTVGIAGFFHPLEPAAWINRIWIDFPLSAAIASTIITWRWRVTRAAN